jgi:ferredoxin
MKIVTVRRISQIFFFTLFVWFCIVSTVGEAFWQIRNWPVNWFLQLDPLVSIGTILTTHTMYWTLLWSLAVIVLTIILGRVFCGWVCPFGALHQFIGFLGNRKKSAAQKIRLNNYRKAQCIKYILLVFLLGMAAFPSIGSSLLTGMLDPIPLITRSFNLAILSIFDRMAFVTSSAPRFYETAWLIAAVFITAALLNLVIPRFYCRFVCPLGALFGIINRFSIWRIGKTQDKCRDCKLCEKSCEGGCQPGSNIRISECVLCLNCLGCKDNLIAYQTCKSKTGEITYPDLSRRGLVLSFAAGVFATPTIRLGNILGSNWNHKQIRPPGALAEEEFLKRCLKCGQCMRICPTNVIQPGGIQDGIENLWTPVLNYRIGSSGCQYNCVACGQICPTSAIRPITLAEKHGLDKFADAGPIRMGTAFFDRNRCLPWAMDKPCIVCQENCPLSPKAIYTIETFSTIRDGRLNIQSLADNIINVEQQLEPDKFTSGDYFAAFGDKRIKIAGNTSNSIRLENPVEQSVKSGSIIEIQVRLQKPYVDIEKCIGCGICEHECPVSGLKAIRVSAVGESRSSNRAFTL